MLFAESAYAQDATEAIAPASGLMGLLPMVLIFLIFYMLLIRPQQKKMKEHQKMVENLRRGDRIVTAGGIIAVVKKVDDGELVVEIAEGTQARIVQSTVSTVLTKEPLADEKAPKSKKKNNNIVELKEKS